MFIQKLHPTCSTAVSGRMVAVVAYILDCWSRRMATYLPTTRAIAATTTASERATARCGGLAVAEHQEAEDAYRRVVGLIAGAGTRILSPT